MREKVDGNLNIMGIKNWQTMARDHWDEERLYWKSTSRIDGSA